MTGYGKSTAELPHGKITVEIKSLNSKFLDLTMKLPKLFQEKEFALRSEIGSFLERGKIVFTLYFDDQFTPPTAANFNEAIATGYLNALKVFAATHQLNTDGLLPAILNLPEVISREENTDENEWRLVQKAVQEALADFDSFRLNEGQKVKIELKNAIMAISNMLSEVQLLEEERIASMKTRLLQNITEGLMPEKVDALRYEQEVLYYLEKMDITEEKNRLKSHLSYFLETLNDQQSNGKKLGFIAQEIGREINTTGAKANFLALQQLTVEMKNELEKIKEQVLNIL